MQYSDAVKIYKYAQEYDISEDTLLTFSGLKKDEYKKLIAIYLQSEAENISDPEHDEEVYREIQENNWSEYFDPARTYRYCLY